MGNHGFPVCGLLSPSIARSERVRHFLPFCLLPWRVFSDPDRRSYGELDILFENKVPAWRFKKTKADRKSQSGRAETAIRPKTDVASRIRPAAGRGCGRAGRICGQKGHSDRRRSSRGQPEVENLVAVVNQSVGRAALRRVDSCSLRRFPARAFRSPRDASCDMFGTCNAFCCHQAAARIDRNCACAWRECRPIQ